MPRRRSRSEDNTVDTADELKSREYRDEDGNVHHHTRRYMRQEKGAGDKEKRTRRAGPKKEPRAEARRTPARPGGRAPARLEAASRSTRAPAKPSLLGLRNRTILLIAVAGVVAFGLGARQARGPSRLQVGR